MALLVSCNISSTSWIYEGMKETLGCGIMMQSVHMPSQDAMHIKKHKPVMDVAGGDGPDLIVDGATLLIHLGVKAEEEFETTTNLEFQMVLGLIKESIKVDPLRYHRMKERLVGVSGETTTAVKRQMQDSGSLPFPAINVNGPFTRIKLDDLNGGRPFCAVQNLTEALPEGVFHTADIFVTTTSNKYIIMVDHMRKMKNNAIVCNIGLGEGPLMNLGWRGTSDEPGLCLYWPPKFCHVLLLHKKA